MASIFPVKTALLWAVIAFNLVEFYLCFGKTCYLSVHGTNIMIGFKVSAKLQKALFSCKHVNCFNVN